MMEAIQPARGDGIQRGEAGVLARLAHFVARRRWWVIAVWIVLTLLGGVRQETVEPLVSELLDSGQVGI